MAIVWLGLGSNIGDKQKYIDNAVSGLKEFIGGVQAAPMYVTAPRDYEDQDDFLNTVIRGETDLEPPVLLKKLKLLEAAAGRTKLGVPEKGPRTIDIDILLYDDQIGRWETGEGSLTIPHSSMHERLFVLAPLLDLNPDLRDPRDGTLWQDKASHLWEQRVKLYRS